MAYTYEEEMLLNNIWLFADQSKVNITIISGKISNVQHGDSEYSGEEIQLTFENAVAFPGLINSHDHLDFNSFPQLGNRIYNSYSEWGKHIHASYKSEIDEILKIPVSLRAQWGVYKNLICGVTTVINHGSELTITEPLIRVIQECNNLHSVEFEKNWRLSVNNPFAKRLPYVVHTGEGIDEDSVSEVDTLLRWNLLKKPLIGVHGVSMNSEQAKYFKALVWCPASNYFLFNHTAPIEDLKHSTAIIFGTDSTLTASWNFWNHIRMAQHSHVSDKDLLAMLTTTPSALWGLPHLGKIEPGYQADIVIARANGSRTLSALNPGDILLVLHGGEIRLFDESLYEQLALSHYPLGNFHKVFLQGTNKYLQGDLPGLIRKIKSYCESVQFPVGIPD